MIKKTARNKLKDVTTRMKKTAKRNKVVKKKKIKLSCRSWVDFFSLDVEVPVNGD
tara:strand:+ start:1619 stop:1783 length:165 start_codon:yes stop_codon:yes gene_type:complete